MKKEENTGDGSSIFTKIFLTILAIVGWYLVCSPFIDYNYVNGEEYLTNSSWFAVVVISFLYFGGIIHLIGKSK